MTARPTAHPQLTAALASRPFGEILKVGTVAIPSFPTPRPQVRVEFFEFDQPAIALDESPQQCSTRLVAQTRPSVANFLPTEHLHGIAVA